MPPDRVSVQDARQVRHSLRRNAVRSEARDIADQIHDRKDKVRHARCQPSLRLHCESYHPSQFPLAWSADHLRVIAKIEDAVLRGGLFAMAMPRGSGKTTLAECGLIWAVLYGHRFFPVLICSDEGSAESMLDSIKTEFETNELLEEDFSPEIGAIVALDGIPHRAGGQVYHGQRTHIGWTAKEIVMPTMAAAGAVPASAASGAVIRVAGITGRIRGMKFKRSDGKSVRPDLVIVDDPQTDESARSVSQSQAREAVLAGAVLGLAGPGKKIAGVMPCTVIRPGDMADRILDTQRHPEWNGERTKLVYAWPTNTKLWEDYAKLRADGLRADGSIKVATKFYGEHRAEMDAGSHVAWEQRFNQDELSALQNAMNLRLTDEAAFFAEYQNEPLTDASESDDALTSDIVASRLSGVPMGALPEWANRITAMIDVSQRVLWWAVVAWSDTCDGSIIDYGAYPEQGRAYFTLRDAKVALSNVVKGAGMEGQIAAGLDTLTGLLFARTFKTSGGAEMKIERMFVDGNWGESTATVYDFCRRSPHSAMLLPSHGRGIGAGALPMSEWKKRPGERLGLNWRISPSKRGLRLVTYDTNFYKSFIASRFLTAPGDPGTLTLYGRDPDRHRMLADQLSAEHKVKTVGRGREVHEWKLKAGRDNHWWDCLVGCAVAASIGGMPAAPPRRTVSQGTKPDGPTPKGDRMSFAALQRAAKNRKSA